MLNQKKRWHIKSFRMWLLLGCMALPVMSIAQANEPRCGITTKNSEPYFKHIKDNIKKLLANKKSIIPNPNSKTSATPTVKFIWPLVPNNISDFTYYRITNYVDMDPNPLVEDANGDYVSGLRDYNCGTRTYDGHNGLDISLAPYHWEMQFDSKVTVVAVADGIIVGGNDGNFDEECTTGNGAGWGNWLALMHDDSTVTTYVHMKENSVIGVSIGNRVRAGQYLGYVASAGNSTGPHLHFGVYINNSFFSSGTWDEGDLVEPFRGNCNTALPSFWLNQKPYNEPSVISIETHNSLAGTYTGNCDLSINLYYDKTFSAGDLVYMRSWIRDWVDGSTATMQLISPSGTVLNTWNHTNSNNSRLDRLDHVSLLSTSASSGTYTVRVTFDGKVWERYFIVGCTQNYTVSGTLTGPKGYVAGNRITSTQVIESGADNRVEYHADNEIILSPGFHAKSGSTLIADRKGCTGGYQ